MPLAEAGPEEAERAKRAPAVAAPLVPADRSGRLIELQHAFLIMGGIALLALAFYGGTKLNYLRYLLATRHQPALPAEGPDKFADLAAEDLVKQALVAEEEGRWDDAVERFMAAKRKDLGHRGILYRVGKILYDHREFAAADQAFERALAFGENTEAASFYRGLIAVRNRDLSAAEGFFDAAIAAAPFVPDYHYYAGETQRLDLKPKPAEHYYERAALLARNAQDAAVCRFKLRMARIEAAESEAVKLELARQEAAGPLSVDWLMTAAALKIRESHIDEARALIRQARDGKSPGLFASCVNDLYFRDLPQKYPELAEVLHLELDLQVPFPN
ncbi:MAG: hypothetical protein M3Q46_13340 [Verrucomicrobiota bacterium]|nr:hypothetical protein [Verrucomicrobiota bacterium]